MKCISLWAPWSVLCVLGEKAFETRSWETSYRGPLLIHSAKRWNKELMRIVLSEPFRSVLTAATHKPVWEMPLGVIVGAVDLVECFKVGDELLEYPPNAKRPRCPDCDGDGDEKMPCDPDEIYCEFCGGDGLLKGIPLPTGNELAFGDYTEGRYAWKLANPRRFDKPVTFRGLQQLFNVPDDVVAEQLAKAGAPCHV